MASDVSEIVTEEAVARILDAANMNHGPATRGMFRAFLAAATLDSEFRRAVVADVIREAGDAGGTLTLTMRCPFHYRTHDLSTDCGWCGGVALAMNSEPEEVELYPTVADLLSALFPEAARGE